MPRFSYKGRDLSGALVSGQVQAASASEAASGLFNDNITPIDISESKGKAAAGKDSKRRQSDSSAAFGGIFSREKVSLVELIIFSRQMYSLAKAGIPLDKALRGLRDSINNKKFKSILHEIGQELEKGMALTDAMGRYPEVFSPLYLSLVLVGENTGRLDLSFQQVGKYLELERNTKKQVSSATRYPIFVLATIAVALSIIMVFVIPVFAETFEQLGAELPWQTILLIDISNFFVNYWYILIGSVVIAFVAFKQYVATEAGRETWDRKKLGFPLIGEILERIALSRFSRTFSMMMTAGVPIVQSLAVISKAVGNTYIGKNILNIRDYISKGESLYYSSIRSGMFSPLVLQMISVGEESGNIGELLDEVADFYDSEVEYDLKKLGAAIEPILIVCIAGMVLILALGGIPANLGSGKCGTVKGKALRRNNGGFTLFEMVVVICSIVILYMVAEERLNSLPAAAERASFFAIYEQIKTGVRFDMYSKLASGELTNLKMLEGSNPMDMLLEVPSNYFGEMIEVTDTNIERRNSWYFETSTGELVYVVGGASIDDVWVSFGNTEVNLGQIRLKLQNVYKETLDSSQILASSDIDESKGATWQALLLEPARPFRWNQQPEQPVEI